MSEINGLRQPEKYFGCYLLKPRIVLKWDTNWEDSTLYFSKQGIGLQKYSFKYDLIAFRRHSSVSVSVYVYDGGTPAAPPPPDCGSAPPVSAH